ncbi:PaaI family thioesterase [Candidatus Caldatribacterium saccharofermentans]|uniref:PaaI family thioesterase n=1 Tax=Candidatus Caldatribacterium saccharofermentans TaxID=1454753 RepID=UPI003D07DD02
MEKIAILREKFVKEGYARFLGMELEELAEGYARVRMKVQEHLHNIFSILHGGALFSLLDEAFELACNSHVEDAVAISVTVHYMKPVVSGDLVAEAKEVALTPRTGLYSLTAYNEDGIPVAFAQALCYRKRKD